MEKTIKNPENIEKTASVRGLEDQYTPHADWAGISKEIFSSEVNVNIDTLYRVVKTVPEVLGCIHAITEDIMADGWKFEGNKRLFKDPIKKADEFSLKSNFYKVLTNALIELLISGNAYILKLSVDEDKIKNIIIELTKTLAESFNVEIDKEIDYELIKQDLKKPKDLQLLKASTIKINFDETGKISSFEQKVHGSKRVYQPQDIIHLSLTNIGGQPYGFTPLEPLLSDLGTLIFAKEFAGKYFENDGMPGWHFNLPEENPDSRNYKLLKKEVKKMRSSKNKHRIMLTTGKIDAAQINKFNKDLEFAKLIQHFTQIILMAMGVPAHRVNLTMDVKQVGGQVIRSYEGYYKKIAFMQKILENSLNMELWNYFRVHMRFNRAYKIDEMREAQIAQILSQIGAVTIEEIRDRIGMNPEIPKGHMPRVTGDDNGIDFGEDQKREQGKEPEQDKTDNKLKLMKSLSDAIEVSFDDFVLIVENKFGKDAFDLAKIFYIETKESFILFFADENWKYKTKVLKESIDVEQFMVERLSNAIKVFM